MKGNKVNIDDLIMDENGNARIMQSSVDEKYEVERVEKAIERAKEHGAKVLIYESSQDGFSKKQDSKAVLVESFVANVYSMLLKNGNYQVDLNK